MNAPVTAKEIMQQSRREPASQATAIEQTRAIAEVQAAITVAQRCPRDEAAALQKALVSCAMMEVAETAFFKLPRSGEAITGESIHLARELARCWGNISYGVVELSRDDDRRVSEMMAFAWDLEANTRPHTTFIVPHLRDTRNGAKPLIDMRDIYENNANMGARRLREQIFSVLPAYLKTAATNACYQTLEKGQGDKPLTVRITEALGAFDDLGISRERLEAKFGASNKWTAADVVQLQVSYRSIKRREISPEEEFPRIGVQEATEAARRIADGNRQGKAETADVSGDAEQGRTDEQHGDQHDGTDPDHPARKVADEIIRATEVSPDITHLAGLKGNRQPDIAAMPDDMATEVLAAFRKAEERLGGKSGG